MPKATAGQIITEVRLALNDINATRWSDVTLYRYIFAGEQYTAGNHPETQYSEKVENPEPVLLTSLTDFTTISVTHYPALVAYVTSRAFSEDSDDSGSIKQADFWMNQYSQFLGDTQVR